MCERELETEHKLQYFDPPQTYGRQHWVFLVLLMLNRRLGVHSAGWWLSLLHLIRIFSGPQVNQGSWGPLQPCVAFPTTSRLSPSPTLLPLARRTQLSYIIVQRPLDLWNRMFNRHQAEITVMQFRGHSHLVHQSMRVSWDFLACPILLANFRPRDFLL